MMLLMGTLFLCSLSLVKSVLVLVFVVWLVFSFVVRLGLGLCSPILNGLTLTLRGLSVGLQPVEHSPPIYLGLTLTLEGLVREPSE